MTSYLGFVFHFLPMFCILVVNFLNRKQLRCFAIHTLLNFSEWSFANKLLYLVNLFEFHILFSLGRPGADAKKGLLHPFVQALERTSKFSLCLQAAQKSPAPHGVKWLMLQECIGNESKPKFTLFMQCLNILTRRSFVHVNVRFGLIDKALNKSQKSCLLSEQTRMTENAKIVTLSS